MNIFDKFKKIVNIDIQQYFEDFSSFILSDYQKIVDYYERNGGLTSDILVDFNLLLYSMRTINDAFSLYTNQLSSDTVEIWELIDKFEETKVKLLTILNSSKWMRSTKNIFRTNLISKDYILEQGQDFEQLALEVGYSDSTNDWVQIAIDNDIVEEDYSFEGGNKLKISFVNNMSFIVNTVIDSLSGKKVYGLDLSREFIFENEDLEILDYDKTIVQQSGILIGLVKGSVPEFPSDGIDKGLSGSNINAIQYPSLFRQLAVGFQKDDRFRSITISKLEGSEESVAIDVQIKTRLDEVLDQQLKLQ